MHLSCENGTLKSKEEKIIVESFTPLGRYGHSSILLGNKLYFFGGTKDGDFFLNVLNEVFFLDVSQQFNVKIPPWTDLTAISGMDFKSSSATIVLSDDYDNPSIYLFGGTMKNKNNENLNISMIHKFNPISVQWNVPMIAGVQPERRMNIQAVFNSGKIYVFGGFANSLVGLESGIIDFNDMVILDINDFTWSYGTILNAPKQRSSYSATLLPNGMIVYIGGLERGFLVAIENLFMELEMNSEENENPMALLHCCTKLSTSTVF
ncbi:2116_t:CDS:2 [Funneliformis geosporum]|uniref:2116_t:CDS:1 n=1 Tax=Funneliformis geosporum TaxID=1117311 RepID=A0A9W4WP97_9GLOM|nr:2116_t:CDS:2 [Funneliformis geosporum]